jgi:hypothetical protein
MTKRARLAAARPASGRLALRQTPTSRTRFQGMCAANTNTASQETHRRQTSSRASSVANRLTTPPPRMPQSQKARPRGRPPRHNSRIVSISALPPTSRAKNTARVLAWSEGRGGAAGAAEPARSSGIQGAQKLWDMSKAHLLELFE